MSKTFQNLTSFSQLNVLKINPDLVSGTATHAYEATASSSFRPLNTEVEEKPSVLTGIES
jgi:hypothetical protein